MRRFIQKSILAALVVLAIFAMIFAAIPAGRIGDVYRRVSSPRQSSLVIGTSRAAQAVNPEIINGRLKGCDRAPLYNFAFHLDASSYNAVYEKAIYSKLASRHAKRGIFILAVDPWALRALEETPQELNLKSYSKKPNVEYLIRNFSRSWFSPFPTHSFVNSCGRTEVDYAPRTKGEWEKRVDMRLKAYREMAANYRYSPGSQAVLERIIEVLKSRGDVFMVRIPTSVPMQKLEDKVCPGFSLRMEAMASGHGIGYLDFSRHGYLTTDGNHLTKKEGDRFSAALSDSMSLRLCRRAHAARSVAVRR